jgi:hypothetical protein
MVAGYFIYFKFYFLTRKEKCKKKKGYFKGEIILKRNLLLCSQ